MTYDLHYGDTEALLGQVLDDEPFLPDLLSAIRDIDGWEHFLDVRLYDLYRAKFAIIVSTNSPPDVLQRFSEHLSAARGVLTHKEESELPAKLAVINDLLKDQLIRLEELRPIDVAKKRHVEPMLKCLWAANGAMERSTLREELKLAEPNLTRVLNLAQTAALITRERKAKSVQVRLTPIGTAVCEKLFGKKEVVQQRMTVPESAPSYDCIFKPQGRFLFIHFAPRPTWGRGRRVSRAWNEHHVGLEDIAMKLDNAKVVLAVQAACSGRAATVPVLLEPAPT